ncbi:LacI family DNA-binding transcriptional regulator [Euzebya sp.]|uniref:LacI family DNA-binding transcriptional regulator n=1 Tax=Euzebya sp. TaxID=1971409 RepID=UPI003512808C
MAELRAAGRPKLRDVAAVAGVSTATVSRVVNDRPGVSQEVRDRVADALRQIGWEPPGLAGGRRARTVGLLVPELDNPIFGVFAQGIESRLGLSGMMTTLCTSRPDGVGEVEHVEALLELGVAALVFIAGSHADTTADHGMYADLVARGVPVVVVNGRVPELPEVASVTCDDVEAGRMATEHLTRLGHRRIGLAAGSLRYVASQRRADGWAKALSDAGLEAGASVGLDVPERDRARPADARTASPLCQDTYTIAGGRRAADALLDEGVTGIVAASDLIAVGALEAVRARGLRVPQDVSVVGYDDSLLMGYLDPPLTTVRQPVDQMCRAIATLCVEVREGRPLRRTELAFRPELIARASTGPAPGLVG